MGGRTAKGMSATGRMPDGRKVSVSLNHVAALASWGTPKTQCLGNPDRAMDSKGRLEDQGFLAAWPTADTNQRGGPQCPMKRKAGGHTINLQDAAMLTNWATPAARDWRDGRASAETMARNSRPLNEQAVMLKGPMRVNRFGQMLIGSDALTETGGQLHPEHVCWLQGYPVEWLLSAPDSIRTRTARAVRSKGSETR
jgi:hypothetical protein